MNQLRVSSALALKSFAFPRWAASILALSTLLSATAAPPHAQAITINMEYFNEGDPVPHDENPNWDPDGTILKAHFQVAKSIWENLLPGSGSYDFGFEWDNDIDELGLTSPYIPDPGSWIIEMNSDTNWFADPTPGTNEEFGTTPVQSIFGTLSAADQATYFPESNPPLTLETQFILDGMAGASGAGGFDANDGFDLLTVILHEIGHVLAFNELFPDDYPINPQHVGGLEDVWVLGEFDTGGSHLAGNWMVPGVLMVPATPSGARILPSATDVLVIAEDQGINNVHLARVDRISAGNWNDANAWIGADVPDATQDVYVRQGGAITLDVNAAVKSLVIDGSSSVEVTSFQLASAGDIRFASGGVVSVGAGGRVSAGDVHFDGGGVISVGAGEVASAGDIWFDGGGAISLGAGGVVSARDIWFDDSGTISVGAGKVVSARDIRIDGGGALSVGAGGTISADTIDGDPATLTTAAGSTIEFNNFTRGASSATAATFNGNVKIGVGASSDLVTFNPDTIATWNVGQNLSVGSFQQPAQLVIDNGVWNVGGSFDIPLGGEVVVDGGFLDNTLNLTGGRLDATGPVTINGALTYKGRRASNTTYTLNGGTAFIKNVPPTPPFLVSTGAGGLTFENTTQGVPIGASVDTAMINVGGGTGDGGKGAVVTFKGNSFAVDAEFWNLAGVGGISLRISNPVVIAGTGGRVIFEDNSYAGSSHFRNDGVAAHGPHGSGGATYFRNNSRANSAVFDNYGSTLQSYTGAVPAPGGRTEFFDTAGASSGTFNNHPGQGMGSLGAGVTIFRGSSSASSGTFYNKGGLPGAQHGGSVEFYENATAGNATFYNEVASGVGQNSGSAGNVRFYGNSTAGNATFHNKRGGGSAFFYDSSTAGDGHFFIENTGSGFGGHVIFYGNSKGGTADLTINENCFSATIEFYGTSNAEQAQITLMNGWQGFMRVTNSASLGQANVDVGSGSGGNLIFRESGTAANSTIRIRPGGGADFTGGGTTAANATITLDGATVANGGVGSLNFTGANAGDATIYVNGGTALNAAGAQLGINNGTNVGTAKIIAGSGVNGGGGGRVTTDPSSNASNARFTIGAGGYLNLQGFGDAMVGSLDAAGSGAVHLGQTGLRIGGLNTLNFINGPITGFVGNGNAKLTKVGINLLELNGANTYYGLTKVDGGTLAINGSTPGAVEVNTGAILKGRGTIGGTVTVNTGGKFAPGNSVIDAPAVVTIGGLAMTSAGTLDFELGPTSYDRIQSAGILTFAGTLNVALVDGFMPALGGMFDLFNWGTKSGTFSTVNLPALAAGLSWDTTQLYTAGVLSVASASISGDFNQNGAVDGADYVAWRKTDGTQAGYNLWRAHFGQTAGSGSTAGGSAFAAANLPSSAVPEPKSLALFLLAVIGLFHFPRGCGMAKNRC